jgi:hypothetical protein
MEARITLRERLGVEVTSIAFPLGLNDARVREALARGGYRAAPTDGAVLFQQAGRRPDVSAACGHVGNPPTKAALTWIFGLQVRGELRICASGQAQPTAAS